MQPAATSLSLNFLTALPTAVTRPRISCPGTEGYSWHRRMPLVADLMQVGVADARISISTSCGRGSRH